MATPSEETCSLSKYRDLVQHYWDKGWAVAPRLFTREEVEQLTHEAQIVSKARLQTLQRDLQSQDQQVRKAAEAARDLTLDGVGEEAKPRKIEAPCLDSRCPSFRRCVADRRVIERIKAIVGKVGVQGKQASNADAQPHPLLLLEQCFMKPPGVGSAKPFHQDNFFFEVDPPDAVVTAWLALDDATVANGCIEYLSGSHKHGLVEHSANSAPKALPTVSERKSVDGAEWSSSNRVDNKAALKGSSIHPDLATALEGVCLEAAAVPKGSVIFHHGSVIHRSGPNNSSTWRRAYSSHWAAAVPTPSARSSVLKDSVKLRERIHANSGQDRNKPCATDGEHESRGKL